MIRYASYHYLSNPKEVKLLAAKETVLERYLTCEERIQELEAILVDIQPKKASKEHHFYGSIRTFAYPAKTEMDTESLVQAVRMHNTRGDDVVIISPRGGRASKRSFDFLVTRGIPEEKLFILKGGIRKWPYKKMLLNIKGGCN